MKQSSRHMSGPYLRGFAFWKEVLGLVHVETDVDSGAAAALQ